jgi:hypothetical protein
MTRGPGRVRRKGSWPRWSSASATDSLSFGLQALVAFPTSDATRMQPRYHGVQNMHAVDESARRSGAGWTPLNHIYGVDTSGPVS